MSPRPTVGIDVGASKVVAAVVDGDGHVLHRSGPEITTAAHSPGLIEQLARMVATLRQVVPDVAAVGVGAAGLVQSGSGEMGFAANHNHHHVKLARNLTTSCGLPVVVHNDADAAAFAESFARHDRRAMLFLAVGTGIGSGFVVNGELVRGRDGISAELGHVVVDRASQERCSCGFVGCLEVVASGRALEREGRRLVQADRDGRLAQCARRDGAVSTSLMIDAALDGDPDVLALVDGMGRALGNAVAQNVLSLMSVDVVVVGGGLAVLGRILLDPMRSACQKALGHHKFLRPPRIITSMLSADATLVGAALLAGQEVARRGLPVELLGRPPRAPEQV